MAPPLRYSIAIWLEAVGLKPYPHACTRRMTLTVHLSLRCTRICEVFAIAGLSTPICIIIKDFVGEDNGLPCVVEEPGSHQGSIPYLRKVILVRFGIVHPRTKYDLELRRDLRLM